MIRAGINEAKSKIRSFWRLVNWQMPLQVTENRPTWWMPGEKGGISTSLKAFKIMKRISVNRYGHFNLKEDNS